MFRILLALMTLVSFSIAGQAETLKKMLSGVGGNSCWLREYTPQELASHPRQKTKEIMLLSEIQDDGAFVINLYLNLRQRENYGKYDFIAWGRCKAAKDRQTCETEWDVGSFVVEKGAKDGIRVRNRKLIFNPTNYDSEDIAPNSVDMGKSDDAVWLLFKAEDGASECTGY